jgi:hypothetical protein
MRRDARFRRITAGGTKTDRGEVESVRGNQ